MPDTFTEKLTFIIVHCADCGVAFGLTSDYVERRRADRRTFWCPNMHPLSYSGGSDTERLRRQLQAEQRARRDAEMRAEMEAQQRHAAERELKQIKRRVSSGVCPCCHRSFPNLRDHMQDQHPGYGDTQPPASSSRGVDLRSRRMALGLTQVALADRAGIRQEYVSLVETERVPAGNFRYGLVEQALMELEQGNG